MENCSRQFRLYGVYPIVERPSDLSRRSRVAMTPRDFQALPTIKLEEQHAYTVRMYKGLNPHVSGSYPFIFVSVVWKDVGDIDAAAARPQDPGGIGFAFGYLHRGLSVFHIVHVNLNRPYRKGIARKSRMSSWVLSELVAAVMQRVRNSPDLVAGDHVEFTIDRAAPCFQMGSANMTEARSQSLQDIYTRAGFEVVPLPHEGRRRRTVRLELAV